MKQLVVNFVINPTPTSRVVLPDTLYPAPREYITNSGPHVVPILAPPASKPLGLTLTRVLGLKTRDVTYFKVVT